MSLITFSAELHPDVGLRRIVLLTGAFLGAVGIGLILTLPFHWAIRVIGGSSWLAFCVWELVRLRRGFSLFRGFRVSAAGDFLLLDAEGQWQAVRLVSGSMVLRRVAWILLETQDGDRCAELIRGHCRENEDWRRLQVIWRHIGATP